MLQMIFTPLHVGMYAKYDAVGFMIRVITYYDA